MNTHHSRPASGALDRRAFLRTTAAAAVAAGLPLDAAEVDPGAPPAEWRNRHPDMAYRRLGRTGYMLSRIVCGGDPIRTDNYRHVARAVELGLNYFDMAPAYGNGDCEIAYGRLLREIPGLRARVFLNTKITDYKLLRNTLYLDLFKTLPGEKRAAILRRSAQLRAERRLDRPGYAVDYYPGQTAAYDYAYLSVAMMADYRHRVEGSRAFRETIVGSLEASLRRLGVDHVDLLMCPHGADAPEEVENEEMLDTLLALKRQGKARHLALSAHNDPAGILEAAARVRVHDAALVAYNVVNGAHVEDAIAQAARSGMGLLAMKTAHAVATHHKALQPIPQERIDQVNREIPGTLKPPLKGYLWSLRNPHVAALASNLWDATHVSENLALVARGGPAAAPGAP